MKNLLVDDYLEASILIAMKVPLLNVEPGTVGRMAFVFPDEKGKAEDILDRHRRGTLKIESLRLIQAILLAKDRLFAARRASGFDSFNHPQSNMNESRWNR